MTTTTDVEIAGTELVPHEPAGPITLFGTSDPRVALERMSEIASALVDVIEKKNLYATINGRRHITVEGWTTLGGMLGVVPVVTGTRANDTGDGIVATVEARTLDGRVVGAADGECSRAERRWKDRDPYALRSMAQTRAISRALRAPLGQIIVLAGYDATPAEEMPPEDASGGVPPDGQGKIPDAAKPTRDQFEQVTALIGQLAEQDPGTDWRARARAIAGVPGNMLTRGGADILIHKLEELAARPFSSGDRDPEGSPRPRPPRAAQP